MDDEAAIRANRAASAAAAWLNAPSDVEAYRRLVDAVEAWKAYSNPQLPDDGMDVDEILDTAYDAHPPQPLGDGVADLERQLRAAARREL